MSPRMGEVQALALALEGRVAGVHGETAELVALSETLAALPDPEIDETFAAALEARLLSDGLEQAPARAPRLTVVPAPQKTSRPAAEPRRQNVVQMPRRRFVVRRSVAAVAAAAMLGAFPIAASASALPGSPFYGLKRAMERAHIAVFGTPVEDGFYHMQLAQERVGEAEQLAALGADLAVIEALLGDAKAATEAAKSLVFRATSDPAALNKLADLARRTEDAMRAAGPGLAAGAGTALTDAIQAARAVQDAVATALGTDPPAAATPEIGVTAPVATTGTTPTSTGEAGGGDSTEPKSSSTDGSGDGIGGTGGGVSDPGGTTGRAKPSEDAGNVGCSAPGSANGLGDLGAPVTRFFCS